MACPFFVPRVKLDDGPWDPAPRLPLGAAWSGDCSAPDALQIPDEQELREICNTGYARGRCNNFPDGAETDAIRFSEIRSGDGSLKLVYILEKDHAPLGHGLLTYSDGKFTGTDDRIVLAQARMWGGLSSRRAGH